MSLQKSVTEIKIDGKDAEASISIVEEHAIDSKSLLQKIDFKVLPMLFVIYVVTFLDR